MSPSPSQCREAEVRGRSGGPGSRGVGHEGPRRGPAGDDGTAVTAARERAGAAPPCECSADCSTKGMRRSSDERGGRGQHQGHRTGDHVRRAAGRQLVEPERQDDDDEELARGDGEERLGETPADAPRRRERRQRHDRPGPSPAGPRGRPCAGRARTTAAIAPDDHGQPPARRARSPGSSRAGQEVLGRASTRARPPRPRRRRELVDAVQHQRRDAGARGRSPRRTPGPRRGRRATARRSPRGAAPPGSTTSSPRSMSGGREHDRAS